MEGEWEKNYKSKLSVVPSLDLLHQVAGIQYIHKNVATLEEFNYHLKRSGAHKSYDIIYLCFHGTTGKLWFPDHISLSLKDLLKTHTTVFKDKYVIFGSCRTIKDQQAAVSFMEQSGAKMVIGYTRNIAFFESTILDITCLEACANETSPSKVHRKIEKVYSILARKLGLVMV